VAEEIGLLEGIASTRAIRRFKDEPVPDDVLATLLFLATRAPSGSNRQPFRFLVLRDGPRALAARRLIGDGARGAWGTKRQTDRYDEGSGRRPSSPKARLALAMSDFVERFESVPVVVLACLERYRAPTPTEGASVYPACQNLLLAARGLGYGGVLTGWHVMVEPELRRVLEIPEHVFVAATIALGRPVGHHGPVRRRPLADAVFEDSWGASPAWAVDPPGTLFTQAGPPPAADTGPPLADPEGAP
jgi:nitroreductase